MNTLRQTLDITLLDDCVFSERAGTEGAHDTLDRIPGSALLGAAAAQLYARLSAEQAYAVFHSGRLRFGDGLPAAHDGVAWPVPMCWHYDKNHKPKESLADQRIFNLLLGSAPPKIQFKQLREGYVSASGRWIKPTRNYRMKTAISPATGRAAEAQLFGYSALQRGQRFVAQIEADADFDPALFARVIEVLQGHLFLGRSRSAEYGRVRIEHRTREHAEQPGPVNGSMLTLWLLSDLAPCNAHGQPTLELDVAGLGLPAGSRIDWAKTFTRSRRYSPWNAKRHGFDSERQVLMAGGVIHIELPEGTDTPALAAQLSRGIGLYREAGLGRVWVNPPLLATEHPAFGAPQAAAVTQPPAVPRPDHPLIDWLSRQTSTSREAIDARVREITEAYHEAIKAARREKGYPNYATDFYPSRSQWGSVLEAARARDGQDLYRALFQGNDAVIKTTGKGWNLEVSLAAGQSQRGPLADWLKHRLADPSTQTCDARLVQQLARRLMDL